MTQTQTNFIGYVILNQAGCLWSDKVFTFRDGAQQFMTDYTNRVPSLNLDKHKIVEATVSTTQERDKEIPEDLTDEAIDQLLLGFAVSQEQLSNHLRALQIKATMMLVRKGVKPFTPCVIELDSETTEILLKDCMIDWEDHVYASELGYDTDGNLVGIRIWGRVSKSSS